MTTVRIATRNSELALAQARFVAAQIEGKLGAKTEILSMTTTGDRTLGSLANAGGKGLFVKEIQDAVLDGRADIAVHSAKDLPAVTPDALEFAAFPERGDPRDALIGRERGASLEGLRRGARIGTGSVRRTALLLRARPDLEIVPIRGNVTTRLRKLEDEDLDAVVLACAGLDRLGLADRIDERISPDLLLPAVAQGTLALEGRRDDPITKEVAALDNPAAAAATAAERAFLIAVGGDCGVPMAAFAELRGGGRLRGRGLVIALDAAQVAETELESEVSRAGEAGRIAADRVLREGGREILDALRDGADR